MKKIITFFILYSMFSFADTKELIYATNPMYPPYDWAISSSDYSGAGIELLKLVLPKEYKPIPRVIPWARAQNEAKIGNIDLLVNLRITSDRQEYLEFTTYRAFQNPIAVFTKKNSYMKFQKWDDLKEYRGGVSLGDTFGGGFDEYWPKELKIETSKNMNDNFDKLLAGRIDYFVTGYYTGMAYIYANQLDSDIKAFDKYISNQDIYFGFSKESKLKSLIPYISKKMEELDKNGTTNKLLKSSLEKYKNYPKIYVP